jgi:hypothetical protein
MCVPYPCPKDISEGAGEYSIDEKIRFLRLLCSRSKDVGAQVGIKFVVPSHIVAILP